MTTVRDAPFAFSGSTEGPDVLDRLEAARIAMRRYFESVGTSLSLVPTLSSSELFTA
jgi:hypothetical protein